jgi:Farnesoic acid 0-methyl transferase
LIGGSNNRKSSIRNGVRGNVLVEVDTLDLLHCSQARWFWVDWSKGIHVGSGPYVGDMFFLNLPVLNMPAVFPVSAVSIATGGTNDGDWEFTTAPGKVTIW